MRPEDSFVGQPIRSLQTMLRVIAEDDSSLPSVVPDGIYGQSTLEAVNAFQRRYALPATGITDQITWERIVEVFEISRVNVDRAEPIEVIFNPGMVYKSGDSSPYLYLLQSMLTFLAAMHKQIQAPPHSGILDPPTAESISGFQVLAGLPSTGELDRLTWKYLVRQFTLNANKFQ